LGGGVTRKEEVDSDNVNGESEKIVKVHKANVKAVKQEKGSEMPKSGIIVKVRKEKVKAVKKEKGSEKPKSKVIKSEEATDKRTEGTKLRGGNTGKRARFTNPEVIGATHHIAEPLVKIDERSEKSHSTSQKTEDDGDSHVTNNETARQCGEKPITNPKRNNHDADSQDTSDDSTPKATNPDKEGIRPRTVSLVLKETRILWRLDMRFRRKVRR
jgi:hypothetical protein